ncbi:MAG: vitamin K epoxide reductase family protein [Candidatus Nanohaloarchaea archaeon]|nr:vitamin K epoxide reductase family protein [Candidatus Nanohaloarchaea archaeon]
MDRDVALKLVIGLSVVGLAVALYQTVEHYFLASAVCDVSATLSCSVVTESRFGEFPPNSGLATAAWGVLWWAGMAVLSTATLKGKEWVEDQEFYLFSYIAAGLVFVIYLLTVELYILPQETGRVVICPFCTVQHVLIVFGLLPLSYLLLDKPVREYLADIFYTEG